MIDEERKDLSAMQNGEREFAGGQPEHPGESGGWDKTEQLFPGQGPDAGGPEKSSSGQAPEAGNQERLSPGEALEAGNQEKFSPGQAPETGTPDAAREFGVDSAGPQQEHFNEAAHTIEKDRRGFLELIYGVLFDPVDTFRRVADSPPLGRIALIFAVVNILVAVMGYYTSSRVYFGDMDHLIGPVARMTEAIIPLLAVGGLLYQFVKWVVFSGLLHLVAELYGGRGRVTGVLAVTGLAGLPSILFIPVQLLVLITGWDGPAATWVTVMSGLAAFVWGVALVVLGLREVHRLSTWRSLAAVLTPAAALIIIVILLIIGMAGVFAAMVPMFNNFVY